MKKPTKTKTKPAPAKSKIKAARRAAAPAVKKAASKAVVTSIGAYIDVGFGNSLHIRGEGPILSWDKGVQMVCVADDEWAITFKDLTKPIECKFLINDLIWCAGENFVVMPGGHVALAPAF